MLKISNLHASILDEKQKTKQILQGINLEIKPGAKLSDSIAVTKPY